jgi:hypothetical protein
MSTRPSWLTRIASTRYGTLHRRLLFALQVIRKWHLLEWIQPEILASASLDKTSRSSTDMAILDLTANIFQEMQTVQDKKSRCTEYALFHSSLEELQAVILEYKLHQKKAERDQTEVWAAILDSTCSIPNLLTDSHHCDSKKMTLAHCILDDFALHRSSLSGLLAHWKGISQSLVSRRGMYLFLMLDPNTMEDAWKRFSTSSASTVHIAREEWSLSLRKCDTKQMRHSHDSIPCLLEASLVLGQKKDQKMDSSKEWMPIVSDSQVRHWLGANRLTVLSHLTWNLGDRILNPSHQAQLPWTQYARYHGWEESCVPDKETSSLLSMLKLVTAITSF